MRRFLIALTCVFAFVSVTGAQPKSADELASAVMKANGSDMWGKVKAIHWTFGGATGRKHVWNLKDSTDTVTGKDGKSTTVKLNAPATTDDEKKAFQAWTNDSYWLIAPLKIKDAGVMLSTKPDETFEGKTYTVLHLAFKDVGLTPGDQYNLLIDPQTMLVGYWDHIRDGKANRMSWEDYKDFKGVKIATMHKAPGTGRKLEMADVSVEFE